MTDWHFVPFFIHTSLIEYHMTHWHQMKSDAILQLLLLLLSQLESLQHWYVHFPLFISITISSFVLEQKKITVLLCFRISTIWFNLRDRTGNKLWLMLQQSTYTLRLSLVMYNIFIWSSLILEMLCVDLGRKLDNCVSQIDLAGLICRNRLKQLRPRSPNNLSCKNVMHLPEPVTLLWLYNWASQPKDCPVLIYVN